MSEEKTIRRCYYNIAGLGVQVMLPEAVDVAGKKFRAVVFNQPNPENHIHNAYYTESADVVKQIEKLPRFTGKGTAKHIFRIATKEELALKALQEKQAEALAVVQSNYEDGLFSLPTDKLAKDKLFGLANKIGVTTVKGGADLPKDIVLKGVIDLITDGKGPEKPKDPEKPVDKSESKPPDNKPSGAVN